MFCCRSPILGSKINLRQKLSKISRVLEIRRRHMARTYYYLLCSGVWWLSRWHKELIDLLNHHCPQQLLSTLDVAGIHQHVSQQSHSRHHQTHPTAPSPSTQTDSLFATDPRLAPGIASIAFTAFPTLRSPFSSPTSSLDLFDTLYPGHIRPGPH